MLLPKWLEGNRINNGGDLGRFYSLILNVKQLLEEGVAGDFAELGVYRGNSAAILAHFAGITGRRAYLLDTFEGFDERDLESPAQANAFRETSLSRVKRKIGNDAACTYVPGYFPESVTPEIAAAKFAFVHLDCDLYKPMRDALNFFYARLAPRGMLVIHDYSCGHWEGVKRAVDDFCAATGEAVILLPDKSGSAILRRSR